MSLLGTFDLGTSGLVANSLRLNLIASNVANAETAVSSDGQPYRARHVVLQSEARAGRVGQGVKVARVGVQPSLDGNTVDPDIERGNFVKNAFFTEAALSFLGSTLRTRLSAITGQPS